MNDFWYRIVKGLKKFREGQILEYTGRLEGEAGKRLRRNKCPRVDFSPEGRPRGWNTGLLIQVKKEGGIEKCIKNRPRTREQNQCGPTWRQKFVGIIIGLCSLLFRLCLCHIRPSRSQTEDRSTFDTHTNSVLTFSPGLFSRPVLSCSTCGLSICKTLTNISHHYFT